MGMKKFVFVPMLALAALILSSCTLTQGGKTLPAPNATSIPATAPAKTATKPPAVAISATPKAGATKGAASPATTQTNPPAKVQAPTATLDPNYPADPNGVAQAFVTAYPDNTAEMLRYLSAAQKAALPSGGPALLLKINGDINGFAVLSGSQSPNPTEAVVVTAMQVGSSQIQRTFNLIKENGKWVINSIT
jgi:hypothetical protein